MNYLINIITIIVLFPYLSIFVVLWTITTTATPILHRIPNEIKNPKLLRKAIWYRLDKFRNGNIENNGDWM